MSAEEFGDFFGSLSLFILHTRLYVSYMGITRLRLGRLETKHQIYKNSFMCFNTLAVTSSAGQLGITCFALEYNRRSYELAHTSILC